MTSVLAGSLKPRLAPPKPDFTRMKLKGRNFCEGDAPTFIYSVHSGPAAEAEPFFAPHTLWVSTCMAPGADRFNYKQMPIWDAFNQYPDTHRVWDGGWCGHIIADKWSGGVSGANCVICLESPHTRLACLEAYRRMLPPQMQSKTRLISLLEMDAVLAGCGAQGPIRFLGPDGKHVRGLEYRAIKTADAWLAFVNNLDRKRDQPVKLATALKFSGIRNLTLETDLAPSFTVPAGETYILKLTQSSR